MTIAHHLHGGESLWRRLFSFLPLWAMTAVFLAMGPFWTPFASRRRESDVTSRWVAQDCVCLSMQVAILFPPLFSYGFSFFFPALFFSFQGKGLGQTCAAILAFPSRAPRVTRIRPVFGLTPLSLISSFDSPAVRDIPWPSSTTTTMAAAAVRPHRPNTASPLKRMCGAVVFFSKKKTKKVKKKRKAKDEQKKKEKSCGSA